MAGDLTTIGAITVDWRRPSIRFTSAPTNHGVRTCSLSGVFDLPSIHTLDELCSNPARQETVSGYTGVKEWLIFTGNVLEPYTGWYVIQSFDPDYQREFFFGTVGTSAFMPFTMSAAYLGDQ